MSERIRYRKCADGKLESVKLFLHSDNVAAYRVMLDVAGHQWAILEDGSGLVVATGRNVKLALLKKEARAGLEALGVKLSTETRKKRQQGVACSTQSL